MRRFLAAAIGLLNIVFWILGIAYTYWRISLKSLHVSASVKEWIAFVAFALSGLMLTTYAARLGIDLLKYKVRARRNCCIVYLMDLLYLMAVGVSWYLVPLTDSKSTRIIIDFWGIAEGFMAPQLGMYYPVVALLAMVLWWSLDRWSSESHEPRS